MEGPRVWGRSEKDCSSIHNSILSGEEFWGENHCDYGTLGSSFLFESNNGSKEPAVKTNTT